MNLKAQNLGDRSFSRHLVARQYQRKKRSKMLIA